MRQVRRSFPAKNRNCYKRYVDDILLIWSGYSAEPCHFLARFTTANTNIKLEWQNWQEAVDNLVTTLQYSTNMSIAV